MVHSEGRPRYELERSDYGVFGGFSFVSSDFVYLRSSEMPPPMTLNKPLMSGIGLGVEGSLGSTACPVTAKPNRIGG